MKWVKRIEMLEMQFSYVKLRLATKASACCNLVSKVRSEGSERLRKSSETATGIGAEK